MPAGESTTSATALIPERSCFSCSTHHSQASPPTAGTVASAPQLNLQNLVPRRCLSNWINCIEVTWSLWISPANGSNHTYFTVWLERLLFDHIAWLRPPPNSLGSCSLKDKRSAAFWSEASKRLCALPDRGYWVGYFISLSFRSFICKGKKIMSTFEGYCERKWEDEESSWHRCCTQSAFHKCELLLLCA